MKELGAGVLKGAAVLALAACALGGCGASSIPRADAEGGGDAGAEAADAGTSGSDAASSRWRAYDFTITLGTFSRDPTQAGDWQAFPKTLVGTVAWNEDTLAAVEGGGGIFAATILSTADGKNYTSRGWTLEAPFASSCDGVGVVTFAVAFSLDAAGALRGTALGTATYRTGDNSLLSVEVDATLSGSPDVTPPTLSVPRDGADPLAPHRFEASEPLTGDGAPSLVGLTSGDVVPLRESYIDFDREIREVGTDVALRDGETYRLMTAGLADFAGHALVGPVAMITTRAAPPLVPEDGFESVTGDMFGGAGVLRGGPLTPIAGATSLLLNTGFGGGFGFLPYALGPSLAVRLAVAPGKTVVHFDGQLIAPDPVDQAAFDGAIRVASTGRTVFTSMDLAWTGFVKESLPTLGDVFVSPVRTVEISIPSDATGEITFEIVGVTFKCGLPPSPTVLVLDNLRVE